MGFVVSKKGVEVDPEKVLAIFYPRKKYEDFWDD